MACERLELDSARLIKRPNHAKPAQRLTLRSRYSPQSPLYKGLPVAPRAYRLPSGLGILCLPLVMGTVARWTK